MIFTALLLSPLFLSPIGLALMVWSYPWRAPTAKPYAGYLATMSAPLIAILAIQAAFAESPGACIERTLNYAPFALLTLSIGLGIALAAKAQGQRRFVVGLILTLCPITVLASMLAAMSLSGCWI